MVKLRIHNLNRRHPHHKVQDVPLEVRPFLWSGWGLATRGEASLMIKLRIHHSNGGPSYHKVKDSPLPSHHKVKELPLTERLFIWLGWEFAAEEEAPFMMNLRIHHTNRGNVHHHGKDLPLKERPFLWSSWESAIQTEALLIIHYLSGMFIISARRI